MQRKLISLNLVFSVKSCQFCSILKISQSFFMISFQHLQGLPCGRVPVPGSQKSTLFGRQWSGIWHTCPSHLSLDVLNIVLKVVTLAWPRMSIFVIFLWHTHLWWNISSWYRCLFRVARVSLPYRSIVKMTWRDTISFLLKYGPECCHTRLWSE